MVLKISSKNIFPYIPYQCLETIIIRQGLRLLLKIFFEFNAHHYLSKTIFSKLITNYNLTSIYHLS